MNKHVIFLAAGNSRRFGTNKLLYLYNGKPMYRYGLDLLTDLCKDRKDCSLLVVTQYEEILSDAKCRGLHSIYSPDSKKGMSYTIKTALKELGEIPEEDYVVFVVADQPHLSRQTVEKLLMLAEDGVETASVAYGEKPGNPTMFSAKLLPELLRLSGDEGGRKVIRNHECIYVQAENEKELEDIDVPLA